LFERLATKQTARSRRCAQAGIEPAFCGPSTRLPLFNAVPLGYLNIGKKVRIARVCGVEYASRRLSPNGF
jgi:hypothetical protein